MGSMNSAGRRGRDRDDAALDVPNTWSATQSFSSDVIVGGELAIAGLLSNNITVAGHLTVLGGNVFIEGKYHVADVQVIGPQGAAVADVATAGSATAAANATAINLILARMRTHGLIATA